MSDHGNRKGISGSSRVTCLLEVALSSERIMRTWPGANSMVRIGSRVWSPLQVERLILLLDSGASAAMAAIELKRSVVVVRAKARNLGRFFSAPEFQ
jgi:hypothetical protein